MRPEQTWKASIRCQQVTRNLSMTQGMVRNQEMSLAPVRNQEMTMNVFGFYGEAAGYILTQRGEVTAGPGWGTGGPGSSWGAKGPTVHVVPLHP